MHDGRISQEQVKILVHNWNFLAKLMLIQIRSMTFALDYCNCTACGKGLRKGKYKKLCVELYTKRGTEGKYI